MEVKSWEVWRVARHCWPWAFQASPSLSFHICKVKLVPPQVTRGIDRDKLTILHRRLGGGGVVAPRNGVCGGIPVHEATPVLLSASEKPFPLSC